MGGPLVKLGKGAVKVRGDAVGKIKNVLHPDKAKEIAKKAYEDYIKSSLQKGYTYFKEYKKKLGDIEYSSNGELALEGVGAADSKTWGDLANDVKSKAVYVFKKLDEKIGGKDTGNGVTKDEYKILRKKTPSNDIRKMVNPDGPKVDPVYGYEVDKFEADHIVSMKEITEMDGFSRLTREQQIEILNLKDNFVGLGKSSNASKGAHSWADWKGHSKMGEVPVNVRMEMLEKEKQAREALKIAIEERLKK